MFGDDFETTSVKLSVTKEFQVFGPKPELMSCAQLYQTGLARNCDSLSFDIYIAWSIQKIV